jgi:hypothetical protein
MIRMRQSVRPMLGPLIVLLLTIAALLVGCGNEKGGTGAPMSKSLNETAARERINAYLLDTLRSLPPGVALSRTPDNPSLATLGDEAAITVPCDDNETSPDGPVQAQTGYWVVGVPAGQNANYFNMIQNYWTARGYRSTPGANAQWVAVKTSDGYSLALTDANKGDGSLSITAGSPCFPNSAKGTTTPQPTELKRPS